MKLKNVFPYKLNLQFFSDGEGDNPGTDNDAGTGEGGEGDQEKLELTPDELQRKIDSETDRKLDKVLKKKQQEWESELQKRIDEAIQEQKRLSKLSEEERKNEELAKREKELLAKEQELARKELLADAKDVLSEKGLPTTFAEILLGEDAEKTLENINNFKKAFDEAVNAVVKEQLRQDTPKAGGKITSGKVPSVADLAKEARLIK